jgi:hypothetical protein
MEAGDTPLGHYLAERASSFRMYFALPHYFSGSSRSCLRQKLQRHSGQDAEIFLW